MHYFLNGGRDERAVLQYIESLALYSKLGVKNMLVIPYAIMEDDWQRLWHENKALFSVPGLRISSLTTYDTDKKLIAKEIARADFVYLPGGVQKTLLGRMEEMGTGQILRQAIQSGSLKLLGGGSAGAMVMGSKCIVGKKDVEAFVDGLGYMPGYVIDSHFSNRNREARLQSVLNDNPRLIGVGIDEDTAAVFTENFALQATYGAGTVSLYYPNKTERYDSNTIF